MAPKFDMPDEMQDQEEVYVVVRGSGRVKVEDEVVELAEWDAIRFAKNTRRNMEAGPEGMGVPRLRRRRRPARRREAPGWWSD